MKSSIVVTMGALLALSLPGAPWSSLPQAERVRVRVETELGAFEVELEAARAPGTVANFLRYVDAGLYDGGRFAPHRDAGQPGPRRRLDRGDPGGAESGQGRTIRPRCARTHPRHRPPAPRRHHLHGTRRPRHRHRRLLHLSRRPAVARLRRRARNDDGQGFAAFGQVVSGMDVVRRIHRAPADERERLRPSIAIVRIGRVD